MLKEALYAYRDKGVVENGFYLTVREVIEERVKDTQPVHRTVCYVVDAAGMVAFSGYSGLIGSRMIFLSDTLCYNR